MTAAELQVHDATPVLLYDGECGLCACSVQFVLAHESPASRSMLRFAALQGTFGMMVRTRHPELALVDSVVWYVPSAGGASVAYVRSDAALAIMRCLRPPWTVLARLGRIVPRSWRDAVYDAIARRRFHWVARACLMPLADQRQRFLP